MSLRQVVVVAAALSSLLLVACKSSDGGGSGAGGGTAPSSTSSPTPGAPGAPGAVKPGVPTVGGPCTPGPDSLSCAQSPTGSIEVTCAGGTWRGLQACRGSGGCSGTGSALRCDTGTLQVGDPCMPSSAQAKCSGKALTSCQAGKWSQTACPSACSDGPPPACK